MYQYGQEYIIHVRIYYAPFSMLGIHVWYTYLHVDTSDILSHNGKISMYVALFISSPCSHDLSKPIISKMQLYTYGQLVRPLYNKNVKIKQ